MGLLDRIADWQRGIYEQEAAMRRQSALQMDQALTAQRQAQQAELLKPDRKSTRLNSSHRL